MNTEINILLANICNDYVGYSSNGCVSRNEIRAKMTNEYIEGIGYTVGKKYAKITKNNGNSVWGFVVIADNDAKFPRGTILKAASWSTPARNFSRGNVLTGEYNVEWTGA